MKNHISHPAHHLSLQVQIDEDTLGIDALPVARPQLRRWVQAALRADAEIVLRFVGLEESQVLNHQYRGKNRPTNVLTFDYAHEPIVQADIVICLPVLEREAAEQHKPLRNHLAHLVIHGVLHAHGMDHLTDEEAADMELPKSPCSNAFASATRTSYPKNRIGRQPPAIGGHAPRI